MEMFYSLIWVVTYISKNVLSYKIKIYGLHVIYNSKLEEGKISCERQA